MSKTIPDFLKDLFYIQNKLKSSGEIFEEKFKSFLTINEKIKNELFENVKKIDTIEIGGYSKKIITGFSDSQKQCYDNCIIYPSKVNQISLNKVYYKLKNDDSDDIGNFCDKNYKSSLINQYLWFGNKIVFKKSDGGLWINTTRLAEKKINKLLEQDTTSSFNSNTSISNSNFEYVYFCLIDESYQINLPKYIQFLVKLIDYETKQNKTEKDEMDLIKSFNEVKLDHETKYVLSPFEKAKDIKLNRLVDKYNQIPNIEFNNKQVKKIKSINEPNIFSNITIELNTNDLYKKEIDEINQLLSEFYIVSDKNILSKSNNFISIISKSYDLIENLGFNNYKSKILISIILKLPLDLLNSFDDSDYNINTDTNVIINVYTCFKKWIEICKINKSINIYKYSYLLMINNFLVSNNEYFSNLKKNNKKEQILEEFMIDVNQSVLTSHKLITDIQSIKVKLEQINLWYWNNENYQQILDLIYNLIIEENKFESKIVIKANSETKPEYILTTSDLSKSNKFFNNFMNDDKNDIDLNYFIKSNTDETKKEGIINNVPNLYIDSSTLIFKFIDFESLNLTLNSNILLMWIQMINICKLTNYVSFDFPYQFPRMSKCELILNDEIKTANINQIVYKAEYNIIGKNIENHYTRIANKLNTLRETNTKYAYIDYYFNYISINETNYLNKMINPYVKYGYELLDKELTNYEPINYDTTEQKQIPSYNFKSKQNFPELLKIDTYNLDTNNLSHLEKLDKKQFNIFFFIYTSLKSVENINSLMTNSHLFKNKILSNQEIDMLGEIDLRLKVIYITNSIKYQYFTNKLDVEFYQLLNTLEKLNKQIYKSNKKNDDKNNKKNNDKFKCQSSFVDLKYINFSIPHINIVNETKVKNLNNMKVLKRFYKNTYNKEEGSSNFQKVNKVQFDKTMKIINSSYKSEPIRKNFILDPKTNNKLYPSKTKKIKMKNFGIFLGNDEINILANNATNEQTNVQIIPIDIDNFRPNMEIANTITLEQIIKINPNIQYLSFKEMFKYLVFLNKLNGNPNIPKSSNSETNSYYDLTELETDELEDFLPPLEKFEGDIGNIDFSNGHYEFIISQTNIYYSPPNLDIVLEYKKDTKIRFIVSNGVCTKYYIDGTIRGQDIWMGDLYSLCVKYVKEKNPKIILEGLRLLNLNIDVETNIFDDVFLTKFKKYESDLVNKKNIMNKKGGVENFSYTDKNLNIIMNESIEVYSVNLPEFVKFNSANAVELEVNENMLEQTIINNLYDLIGISTVHYNTAEDKIFTNKICDAEINDLVFPIINYNNQIKQLYATMEKENSRNIYICGRDMFGLYDKIKLVKIYNSSPETSSKQISIQLKGSEIKLITNDNLATNEQITKIENYEQFKKSTTIGYEYEFNSQKFKTLGSMDNIIFTGFIDANKNITLSSPYYLDNPIFYNPKYFIYDNKSNKLIPTKTNLLYSGYILTLNDGDGSIELTDEVNIVDQKLYLSLFKLEPYLQSNTNNFITKLINAIPNKSNIICWVNPSIELKTINMIDVVNLGVRFNCQDGRIIMLNQYEIILDYTLIDWRIKRWVYSNNEKNTFDWSQDRRRIFLAKNKNTYCLVIFFLENYIVIKIDPNTYLPIFNNSEPLLLYQFIKFYDYEIDMISDLYPLIVKNNLSETIYGTRLSKINEHVKKEKENREELTKLQNIQYSTDHKILTEELEKNFKLNSEIKFFIDEYESIDYQIEKKSNYYIEYEFININQSNYEYYNSLFYQQFYFADNKLKSFGDFMCHSLVNNKLLVKTIDGDEITMSIMTFNLFYYKLKNKIYSEFGIDENKMRKEEINEILAQNYIEIMQTHNDNGKEYFKTNPLEFYYQYIFGYFARTEQLEMANEIFSDITGHKIKFNYQLPYSSQPTINRSNNFRLNKFIQINPDCFELIPKTRQPNIYNLIMGAGKTSMITPLVIIKYLQFATTKVDNSSNCYIVLPEKLVNPSCDKLSSIFNLYFPVNLQKCIETRKNTDLEQKYNLTYLETIDNVDNITNANNKLDPYNLNVFVMSDTSLKSGFINNYNKILSKQNKSNIYLFDEVDTIINPITSELNYPLSNSTKSINGIEEIFELIYKIYFVIFRDETKSLKHILSKYPNYYRSNKLNHFIITDVSNESFIDELKCWLRTTIAKHYKVKNLVQLSRIIETGFSTSYYELEIGKLSSVELNIIYIINNFINVVFIQSLVMVNRVNYGTYFLPSIKENKFYDENNYVQDVLFDKEVIEKIKEKITHNPIILPKCSDEDIIKQAQISSQSNQISSQSNQMTSKLTKYLIIPFANNEDPVIGSKFSNPIMTLCLTIINYIIKNGDDNIIDLNGIKNIMEIIYNQYINSTENDKSHIEQIFKNIFGTKYKITEITDIDVNTLNDDIIRKIKSNDELILLFCKKVCIEELKVDIIRFNVSGVDLMISSNIYNRSGFSGTIGIPQIIDTHNNKQLIIKPDTNTIDGIERVLETKCGIQIYNSGADMLNELTNIIKLNQAVNINTIIDAGGIFVNIGAKEIWNKLNQNKLASQMYFWNDDDRPQEYIETSSEPINTNLPDKYEPINENNRQTFYYYDQKHTTGIDAKIPWGSVGLVFLNKTSRYRDVVQSMFRMRKLIGSNEIMTHKIIFCIGEDICKNIDMNLTNPDITRLINWFNSNENKYLREQEISSHIQNINSISRIIRSKTYSSKSNNKSCLLLSNNYFREINKNLDPLKIKELVEGTKTSVQYDLTNTINNIRENERQISENKEQINNLVSVVSNQIQDTDIINSVFSQSQNISQTQVQIQSQTQSQTQSQAQSQAVLNTLEEIGQEKTDYDNSAIGIEFNIQDYFDFSNTTKYTNILPNILYSSVNTRLYQELYPSTIIYLPSNNKILIVPNLEGFKLIDWLSNTPGIRGIPEKYLILDSTGTIYLNVGIDDIETLKQIQSWVKIILSTETDRNIITEQDKINFTKFVDLMDEKNQQNIETYLLKNKNKRINT